MTSRSEVARGHDGYHQLAAAERIYNALGFAGNRAFGCGCDSIACLDGAMDGVRRAGGLFKSAALI